MLVPALVVELDEAHAALGQPPREQAVGGEGAGLAGVRAVQVDDRVRLAREVHDLRDRRLHPVGHLVLRDARVDLGVHDPRLLPLLERAQRVEHAPPAGAVEPGGIGEVEHRVLPAAELHALVLRGQEAAAPEPRVERLVALPRAGEQHDERRQVLVLGAEAVGEPGADRRPARPAASPSGRT